MLALQPCVSRALRVCVEAGLAESPLGAPLPKSSLWCPKAGGWGALPCESGVLLALGQPWPWAGCRCSKGKAGGAFPASAHPEHPVLQDETQKKPSPHNPTIPAPRVGSESPPQGALSTKGVRVRIASMPPRRVEENNCKSERFWCNATALD